MAKDLVCNMEVKETGGSIKAEYAGKPCYFCSDNCKREFLSDPDKYLKKTPAADGSKSCCIANESKADRIIRLIIGIIFVLISLFVTGGLKIIFSVLGIIALFTSTTGICLVYKILGISTLKNK